jgi:transposase InsO family protein
MKESYPHIGLARICRLFGITRQAYYDKVWFDMDIQTEHEIVLQMVVEIRNKHKRMGGKKLYELISPHLVKHQIKMGRDAFFYLLALHGMLIRRRKRKAITTHSYHRFKIYPNLVEHWLLNHPNQIWVSDITYLATTTGFLYLFLVTDAYSKKVMGYCLGQSLEAEHAVSALQMAIDNVVGETEKLIHHSDRGVQYCCDKYVKLLKDNNIRISMTQRGDPLENPVAERVNGILKEEYLLTDGLLESLEQTLVKVDNTIKLYNQERPHLSCDMATPEETYKKASGILARRW